MIDPTPKEHACTVKCIFGDIFITPTLTRRYQRDSARRGLASNYVLDARGQGEQYVI